MSAGRGTRGEKQWMGEGLSTWTHTYEPKHTHSALVLLTQYVIAQIFL